MGSTRAAALSLGLMLAGGVAPAVAPNVHDTIGGVEFVPEGLAAATPRVDKSAHTLLPIGGGVFATTTNWFTFPIESNVSYLPKGDSLWTDVLTTQANHIGDMVEFDGKAFIAVSAAGFASPIADGGVELYSSDGVGFDLEADILDDGSSFPTDLMVAGGKLYFLAQTPSTGRELYVCTGSGDGASLVHEFAPGAESSAISAMTPGGDFLYFQVKDSAGTHIFRTDGTDAGTVGAGEVNALQGDSWWGGRSLDCDGDDLMTTSQPLLDYSTMTVEAWVHPTQANGENRMPIAETLWNTFINDYDPLWKLEYRDNHFWFRAYLLGAGEQAFQSSAIVTPNQWNHVAFVFDEPAGEAAFYVNGVQTDTFPVGAMLDPTVDLVGGTAIGGSRENLSFYPYRGQIDEFRFWNVARTAGEIAATFNSHLSSGSGLVSAFSFDGAPVYDLDTFPSVSFIDEASAANTLSNSVPPIIFQAVTRLSDAAPMLFDATSNRLIFAGCDANGGVEPWSADGSGDTAAAPLLDLSADGPGGSSYPADFLLLDGDRIAFSTNQAGLGGHVWACGTDGSGLAELFATPNGVADGEWFGGPSDLTLHDGNLLFVSDIDVSDTRRSLFESAGAVGAPDEIMPGVSGSDAGIGELTSTGLGLYLSAYRYGAQASDACEDAAEVTTGVLYEGSNIGMATGPGGTSLCIPLTGVSDVWYRYRPATDGVLTVTLDSGSFDPLLSIVGGGCPFTGGGVDLACNNDSPAHIDNLAVTAGVDYTIRVAATGGFEGAFSLFLEGPRGLRGSLPGKVNSQAVWQYTTGGTPEELQALPICSFGSVIESLSSHNIASNSREVYWFQGDYHECSMSFISVYRSEGVIDLGAGGSNIATEEAAAPVGSMLGWNVSGLGDVNGDGFEDFAASAPSATAGASANAGITYVVLGNAAGDLDSSKYVLLRGSTTNDRSGISVSGAGDFNGDGYKDIVIGAPHATRSGRVNQGEAYIVFGSATRFQPGATLNISDTSGGRGVKLVGSAANALTGASVSGVGNLNGDRNPNNLYGFDDIIVSAPGANSGRGEAYVLYGLRTPPSRIDLATLGAAGTRIRGINTGDGYGTSVAGAGDVDGDGYPDLLARPTTDTNAPAAPVLVYGRAGGLGQSLNLAAIPPGIRAVFFAFQFDSVNSSENMGCTVGDFDHLAPDYASTTIAPAGDMNGDGLADILVSNPFRRDCECSLCPPVGKVYLVYGSYETLGSSGLLSSVLGDQNSDGSQDGTEIVTVNFQGYYVPHLMGAQLGTTGDMNGDGFSDFFMGSLLEFTPPPGGGPFHYIAQGNVAFGRPDRYGFGDTLFLGYQNSSDILAVRSTEFGFSTFIHNPGRSAGDFNLDGVSDLVMGVPELNQFALALGGAEASEATYNNSIRSGVSSDGFTNQKVPLTGIGESPDGSFGVPLSRVAMAFEGGSSTFGTTLPSHQIVTLRRSPVTAPLPSWNPAPIHWVIQTNRETATVQPASSSIVFHYTDEEFGGRIPARTGIYQTPDDPPTATSPWTPVFAVRDPARHTFTVARTHLAGNMSSDLTGTYAIIEVNEIYDLGDEIIPPTVVRNGIDAGDFNLFDPSVAPAGWAFWHAGTKKLYAVSTRSDPQAIEPLKITWKRDDQTVAATQIVNTRWPDDPELQIHVSGTPDVDATDEGRFTALRLIWTDEGNRAGADKSKLETQRKFAANGATGARDGAGRSLILASLGADPRNSPIYFLPIRTVPWTDPVYGVDKPAYVGDEILEPAYHTDACGGPFVFFDRSYYNAQENYYDRAAQTGPIIPVNTDQDPNTHDDDMVVAFYQKTGHLKKGLEQTIVPSEMCFPWKPVRYDVQWDPNAPEIVIARLNGSGPLDSLGSDFTVYTQNSRIRPGFNPNEEHSLILSGTIYPLRTDLNVVGSTNPNNPNTSAPYALAAFARGDGHRAMKAFHVLAEKAPYFFAYTGVAGTLVQAPVPLSILLPPAGNCPNTSSNPNAPNGSRLVSGQGFVDKGANLWARAAAPDADPPAYNPPVPIVYQYFYPNQTGFYYPGQNPPEKPSGTCVPWLDKYAGTPGVPVNITYNIVWPDNVPELRMGETLVKAKNGLPDVVNQISVDIVYQQSVANGEPASALLYEPLRVNSVPLPGGPPSTLRTEPRGNKLVFTDLPPPLKARLYYTPDDQKLNFSGFFQEPPIGEYYVLPNVLTVREKNYLFSLSANSAWRAALAALPAPTAPDAGSLALAGDPASQKKALTSTGLASGFVTLAFNNSPVAPPAAPVSLEVIRVTCPPYRGSLIAIDPDCAFDEKITMRHTGDLGGRSDDYTYQWAYQPDTDGTQPDLPIGDPGGGNDNWIPVPTGNLVPQTGQGAVDFTIGGPGLLTLSDNWFVMRYKKTNAPGDECQPSDYSLWTPPQLAQGWIKRVLGRIDPFKQRAVGGGLQSAEDRFFAFQNQQINTVVSMLSQAGKRYEGDIAFNCSVLDQYGLIEIYQTVLNRGIELSINGTPPVDYAPANTALLLAAGRIADLYMLLGNEAYADASDPTIGIGTDSEEFGSIASSIHCFENQTASLTEEELALLRGRDDRAAPGTHVAPVYNRLIWNFTHDITGGEVAYALNYNIKDQSGNVDGIIDAGDAARLYPQGHGDAWGHYLTAIKSYYRLLRDQHYTWTPRAEAVLVAGTPVSVDYFDERKFASAAAAKARTGAEIVNLTYRAVYTDDPAGQYLGYRDADQTRAWGLSEWGSRAGQGAYLDWVVANAIIPPVDTVGQGIQKIDRTTVQEMGEISASLLTIQAKVDEADGGLNPLGVSRYAVPFDIDPNAIGTSYQSGLTHFEQVYERAIGALSNAVTAFDHANASTQALRSQADAVGEFQKDVENQEADYRSRLLEIFGYPYSDDIGPGKTYATGYEGPDYLHWMWADSTDIAGAPAPRGRTVNLTFKDFVLNPNGSFKTDPFGLPIKADRTVQFFLSDDGKGFQKPPSIRGTRRAPGEIQLANQDLILAKFRMEQGIVEYRNLIRSIEDQGDRILQRIGLSAKKLVLLTSLATGKAALSAVLVAAKTVELGLKAAKEATADAGESAAAATPTTVIAGLAGGGDFLSPLRGAFKIIAGAVKVAFSSAAVVAEIVGVAAEQAQGALEDGLNVLIESAEQDFELEGERLELKARLREEAVKRLELYQLQEEMQQAQGRLAKAVADGTRLIEDRTRFRRQTSASVQEYRYKDMAFRIFRNDALQQYRAQFDLAALYAFLATKAYDYETNLLPGDPAGPGQSYLTRIIRSRSLGTLVDGVPQTGGISGDPGIASQLARIKANWDFGLKSRLGFNNPIGEQNTFSLRRELFRIPDDAAHDADWRAVLEQAAIDGANILDDPAYRRYAIPLSPTEAVEPGLVFRFSTNINFGLNFFKYPLGSGDSALDSTTFATKVRRHALVLRDYDTNTALSSTPRAYMFPVGSDIMRSPTGNSRRIREWRVLDQQIPTPFNLTAGDLEENPDLIPRFDALAGDFAAPRRFPQIRAVDENEFSPDAIDLSSRLTGRSIWNTEWVVIIPAGGMLADRAEAIRQFIYGADGNGGISDISVYFETYSYAASGRRSADYVAAPDDSPPPLDLGAPEASKADSTKGGN